MHANIVCPGCGHSWEPAARESACPQCHTKLAVEWNIKAPPKSDALPPDSVSEGDPPFVLPVDDEDSESYFDDYDEPRGWAALSVTIALIGLSAGIDLWHASVEIDKCSALLDMLDGHNVVAQYQRAQTVTTALTLVELVLLIASTIAAWTWVQFSYANLDLLRVRDVAIPPAWGIYRWLVPPGLLFVPPRMLQELWRVSDPKSGVKTGDWKTGPGTWLIWFWWAFFLLRHIRININMVPFPLNEPTQLKILLAASCITAAACFCGVIAAALFIVLALRLERRQWRRFARLR